MDHPNPKNAAKSACKTSAHSSCHTNSNHYAGIDGPRGKNQNKAKIEIKIVKKK